MLYLCLHINSFATFIVAESTAVVYAKMMHLKFRIFNLCFCVFVNNRLSCVVSISA